MQAPSAATIEERALVRHVFDPRLSVWTIYNQTLGLTGPFWVGFEVDTPLFSPEERVTSELDVIVWPQDDPAHSIAIECKRVTVSAAVWTTHLASGVRRIHKGVQQANALLEKGFHRSYLAILIAVDGREQFKGAWTDAMLPPALLEIVMDPAKLDGLHPDVGVIYVQAGQVIDKELRLSGGMGRVGHRPAAMREQRPGLTNRIEDWIRTFPSSPQRS